MWRPVYLVIYFTEGHEENDVDYYYRNLKVHGKDNILVKKINLMTVENIPEDAELVIAASPKRTFHMPRGCAGQIFLQREKAIFMFDYLENDPSFEELNGLLGKFNLAVNYDKVRETDDNRHLPGPYTPVVDVSQCNHTESIQHIPDRQQEH